MSDEHAGGNAAYASRDGGDRRDIRLHIFKIDVA